MNPTGGNNGASVNPFANQGSSPNLGIGNVDPNAKVYAPNNASSSNLSGKMSEDGGLQRTIVLTIACLLAAAGVIFLLVQFLSLNSLQKNNETDTMKAVETAKVQQQVEDEEAFLEQDKLPLSTFMGVPSDLGALRFQYPKTWHAYVKSDGSDRSDYVAYFRPSQVLPVEDARSRFALRFTIKLRGYGEVYDEYKSMSDSGLEVTEEITSDSGVEMTRFDGTLSEGMEGSVVLIKINDYTAILQTDAEIYKNDFDALLRTVTRGNTF